VSLPNRITVVRMGLIPVVLVCLHFESRIDQLLAVALMVAGALTDILDGYLARRNRVVTNFGKFLDPVADKLLVLSTMIALCGLGRFPAWACVAILFREIAVDGLRMVAMERRKVIAAGVLGKIKTTLQMAAVVLYMVGNWPFSPFPMDFVLLCLAVIMTLWSGIVYFWQNRDVLAGAKDLAGS